MAFTIDQLITAQTADQFRASMVAALVGVGIPANQWRPGGVFSTILTVVANILATLNGLLVSGITSYFLPIATGGGLQLLAQYVYGIDPSVMAATFATGEVTLTNSGGGVYTVAVGALTVGNTNTGFTYTNTTAFTILGKTGGIPFTITVPVEATTVGSASNANPGDVTTMVTTFLGVTVNNSASIVGRDAISDTSLRQLCLNSLGIRSVRGPRTAYGYAIQTATNPVTGAPVNINRYQVSAASHTGIVTVTLAAPSGTPDPEDVIGVENNIEAIARPEGVTVVTQSAAEVPYTKTLTVWATAQLGANASALTSSVSTGITNFFANYPIGGLTATDNDHSGSQFTGVFGGSLIASIGATLAANGAVLVSVQAADFATDPSMDLALTSNEVATDDVTVLPIRILSSGGAVSV